jgi:hypothetical protein
MVDADASSDPMPCDPWLADYRAAVERLRQETAAELGGQPSAPESAAMVAVLVAALPLVALPLAALLHPSVPVHLQVWQVGVVQATVWGSVYWHQRRRYDRFHERLRSKIAAHQAAEGAVMAPRILKRRFSPAHPGRRPATALRRTAG